MSSLVGIYGEDNSVPPGQSRGVGTKTGTVVPNPISLGFALVLPLLSLGCGSLSGSASEARPTEYRSPKTDHPITLLTPSSKTIDLGFVPQAGQEQETFSLSNTGTKPVDIAKIETSCDCLELRFPRRTIGPSEKILVRAKLDLTKEPQFLGGLGIVLKGQTCAGETVFFALVTVPVCPPNEFDTFDPREAKEDAL